MAHAETVSGVRTFDRLLTLLLLLGTANNDNDEADERQQAKGVEP
jgi:hypothetical protein